MKMEQRYTSNGTFLLILATTVGTARPMDINKKISIELSTVPNPKRILSCYAAVIDPVLGSGRASAPPRTLGVTQRR
jgi:hypothetical protein